jgi:predicted CoA-binding protein
MACTEDKDIVDVLTSVKTIALVGASQKAHRASNRVMRFLLDNNYQVIPVNPALSGTELMGQTVYATLADIPFTVDMIDVFRDASHLQRIVEEAISLNIKTIWTQLEVVDAKAINYAEDNGICMVVDRCPAIEIPRLSALGLI